MNAEKEVDFIVVGQGLAGSALALELINRNQKVFVFDKPENNHSSAIAAGLFNPITGKVMTKTWKADLLFPYLVNFYSKAEEKLNAKFFHPMPLFRPFISIQEQNEWMGRSADPAIQSYLKQIVTESHFGNHIHDDLGGLLLSLCGYVDTNLFMESVRKNLIEAESYAQEHVSDNDILVNRDFVSYKNLSARKIIFCNGTESMKSKFFSWLPLRPLKGETIHVKLDQKFECIYNRGVYIVPGGEAGRYKVGATYSTKDMSESITTDGGIELKEKLSELLKVPYEVATQNWGIRPSTADRRPFLGGHPQEKNVVIFNGLGTKGVSLAPYFAAQLANWLTGRGDIDPAVDISRFKFKK